jgi:hypothetical protein
MCITNLLHRSLWFFKYFKIDMKRIHLIEVEDLGWFPDSLRQCLTRLIVVMHKLIGSPYELAQLVRRALKYADKPAIIDLCSGSGGPMIEVFRLLETHDKIQGLTLTLTDLYPNQEAASKINNEKSTGITYLTNSVNASNLGSGKIGVRTMVCSLHHMRPEVARNILKEAIVNRQPICIFEISDNSLPLCIWWIAIPMNFIMAFFITPLIKPLSWKQLVFTYIIPVIPICFAWDGAVSNVRTYTLTDMDELLKGLETECYTWEKGRISGIFRKLYLLGLPVSSDKSQL